MAQSLDPATNDADTSASESASAARTFSASAVADIDAANVEVADQAHC